MKSTPAFLPKLPMVLLVAAALLSGIFTGWFRLGFSLPVNKIFLHHGAIMTGSFLGTVILVERIVALKKRWLFVFPVVNASSIAFYYAGLPQVAFSCLIAGAAGLFFVFYLINNIHTDLPHQVMWAASGAWFVGNVHLLLFGAYAHSILWWMAFLLATIAGERLELNKFLPVSNLKKWLLVALLAVFGVACAIPFHLGGRYLAGSSLLLVALWLLRYDMIWKSIKRPGIHRYSAITLLFGYLWLGVAGIFYLLEVTGVVPYDALVHSFFLGFVFSMIFAHAPIILPGVLGLTDRPFGTSLYVWVALFQLSLATRLTGGLLELFYLKKWSGLVNGVVILCFLVNMGVLVFLRKRRDVF